MPLGDLVKVLYKLRFFFFFDEFLIESVISVPLALLLHLATRSWRGIMVDCQCVSLFQDNNLSKYQWIFT